MLKMFLFIFHLPKKDTFLIAELNTCHGELLPSWIKFLKDSGQQFEIIVNKEVYKELQPFDKYFENVGFFLSFSVFTSFFFLLLSLNVTKRSFLIQSISIPLLTPFAAYLSNLKKIGKNFFWSPMT